MCRAAEPIRAREGVAGRDATDPRLLVGLWLYACIRGIGSARELARRCEESAAFRWLCGGVTVNHRLPSDFRGDHGAALDQASRIGRPLSAHSDSHHRGTARGKRVEYPRLLDVTHKKAPRVRPAAEKKTPLPFDSVEDDEGPF
jgi:Transposase domain (DUF772)